MYTITLPSGNARIDVDAANARLRITLAGQALLDVPLRVSVSPAGSDERDQALRLASDSTDATGTRTLVLEAASSLLNKKRYLLSVGPGRVALQVQGEGRLDVDRVTWFKGDSGRSEAAAVYVPRFDWAEGAVIRPLGHDDALACQQWLSPPPFCYGLQTVAGWTPLGIEAEPGMLNCQAFELTSSTGVQFALDYESHWTLNGAFKTPTLVLLTDAWADPNEALAAHVQAIAHTLPPKPAGATPAWWAEPLFCSWGEQRLQYRLRHDNAENGWWVNAGDYANEQLFRQSLAVLEQHDVHPGTVIVDCFWSMRGSFCDPDPLLWSDLKGFIAGQHKLGRRVLLWLTPILFDGLPLEACITLDGQRVAADPTSEVYRRLFAEQIERMVSPAGLDADGFKIDFTQNIPSENGLFRNYLKDKWAIISEKPEKNHPKLTERSGKLQLARPGTWGVEIIRAYLSAIREPMKAAKPDALLITHTPHPALRDLPDMIRLNDLDGTLSRDVPAIMRNRAAITRACGGEHWLIDTDNDLMIDKAMWRAYIADQPRIGVPDTYYATGIATSGERFDADDYKLLRDTWAAYRRKGL